MAPPLVRRRRDGLVEIRRIRARDIVLSSDTAILLLMLGGWIAFTGTVVLSLVFDPPFLLFGGWLVLALFIEQRHAAAPPLAPARTNAGGPTNPGGTAA